MKTEGFRIADIHAFITVGDDGDEGVIGMTTPAGWVPFIAADPARLEQLRPLAVLIGKQFGQKIKLVRFSTRTEVEDIT